MKVDGRFRSLSPEEQAATVDEIAQSPYFRAQPTKPDYSDQAVALCRSDGGTADEETAFR